MPKSKSKTPAPLQTTNDFAADMERAGCQHPTLRKEPLWLGPESDAQLGGVTQSMLQSFLVCRERFRLKTIEGIGVKENWNHRLGYGNMWHVCEEALAVYQKSSHADWGMKLREYGEKEIKRFPEQATQINHWYNVCKRQFPLYVEHWKSHPDVVARKPLYSEKVFNVPYVLPGGRTVYLKGKWDSTDLVGGVAILQENKTKGDWSELFIEKQLTFDLQTMIYIVALRCHFLPKKHLGVKVGGVRYNCVRRPLSGGKHSIKRKEPTKSNPQGETQEQYYSRLQDLMREEPQYYFARWDVPISEKDIVTFCRTFLDPVLEQLCDWYVWVTYRKMTGDDVFGSGETLGGDSLTPLHWRMPYGVYSPLIDGGATDLDDHLATGSMVGLTPLTTLFPELE